jgi:raffinose/stachyose/melibiose transport system substrate-binding protein
MLFVACGTPAPTASPEVTPPEATEAEVPAPTEVEARTLYVTDVWVRPEDSQVIETLNAEFEAAHPGVTVERTQTVFEDLRTTLRLQLANPEGLDVVMVSQGYTGAGQLIPDGLLSDLTPCAEANNWQIPEGLLAQHSWSADGSVFGSGNIYGMGPTVWLAGVYYNKDIFEDVGIEIPRTFAEFEADLETINQAGITPIVLGNLDGLAGHHMWAMILYAHQQNRTFADGLLYGDPNARWTDEAAVSAAATLQRWAQNGYFTPGFEGIAYEDQLTLFENEEAAMFLVGNWFGSGISASPIADHVGYFLLPGVTEDSYRMALGGTSTGYSIRAASANQDLACDYVSWMASERAGELWAEAGMLPSVGVDPSMVEPGTVYADTVAAWDVIQSTDALGAFLDWSTPTAFEVHMAAIQDLMASRITPEEFGARLQADRDAFLQP